MQQLVLAKIAVEKEVDGIPMGVLEDGTGYLTGRGLARVCDVAPSAISTQAAAWEKNDRTSAFAKLLVELGFNRPKLYVDAMEKGVKVNAYQDDVCMIFLHYYANVAREPSKTARSNHLKLSIAGLRVFIYTAVGYDPLNRVPAHWRQFHDRLLINKVPPGYFSVFREMADLVLFSIQSGLRVDSHTVPDVSVGSTWGRHWNDIDGDTCFGARIKHPHVYPDYFPQAAANGEITAWVYPLAALGDFREWMQNTYLPEKFPSYLQSKVKQRALPASGAELILKAFELGELPVVPGTGRLPGT